MIISLLIIILFSSGVYLLAAGFSPIPTKSREKTSTYACGENLSVTGIVVDPTLYKYSVYFLIFDSAVFLLAFASQALEQSGVYVVGYLLLMFLSVLLLPKMVIRIRGLDLYGSD